MAKTIEDLYQELTDKIKANDPESRTVVEFNGGTHTIGKKIVEEAAEVWMACEHEGKEAATEEISQLIYHTLVMMLRNDITLDDVYGVL
jgi:phosphoribosyl-ATP pyrophosphohydrolase